jgi:ribosomal protein S18 acetylase RimI-like enzyme
MIRKGLPSDAKAIAQVHISSWQDAYRDLMPAEHLLSLSASLPQRESYWIHSIESGESNVFVAELSNEMVGWISVGVCRDEDMAAENMAEVMALYVLAEHWKTGVGLALWQSGLRHLIAQRYQGLTLWVLTGNERASRFYRRVGCIEETGSERNLERGGAALVEVRYRLPLIL